MFFENGVASKEVPYSKLDEMLLEGCVKEIVITSNKNKAEATLDHKCASMLDSKKEIKEGEPLVIYSIIPSVDEFAQQLAEYKKEGKYSGITTYKDGKNDLELFL